MSIENISRLVSGKSHDGKVPGMIHDYVRETEISLERFRERYRSLKDHKNDLDDLGVEWEEMEKEIRKIIEDIIRY